MRVIYPVFKGEGVLVLYCEPVMTALYRNESRVTEHADAALEAKARG